MLGLSKTKMSKFKISSDGKVELRFLMPTAVFDGLYDVTGQLLKLKIKGKGRFKSTISKIKN